VLVGLQMQNVGRFPALRRSGGNCRSDEKFATIDHLRLRYRNSAAVAQRGFARSFQRSAFSGQLLEGLR